MLRKILTTLGSLIMIGFGVWHFTVPAAWSWYSYITPSATELVLAVGAINIFFSLCLVLIGIMNLIFMFTRQSRFVLIVTLTLSTLLWAVRTALQIVYPQGSINVWLQYGMLSAFVLTLICFAVSLIIVMSNKGKGGSV